MKLLDKIRRVLNPYYDKIAVECTDTEFLKLIEAGEKIKAIKRYRSFIRFLWDEIVYSIFEKVKGKTK